MEKKKRNYNKKNAQGKRRVNDDIKLPAIQEEKISFNPHGNRKFRTDEELRAGILAYFEHQKKELRPFTVIGLCCWFGMHRDTWNAYRTGVYDSPGNKFSDTVKEAAAFIENEKLEKSLMGIYNSTIAKFDLANNHGYSDKSETANMNLNAVPKAPDNEKGYETFEELQQAFRALLKD